MIGWVALFIAFVSPLCALTAALFLARASHHIIIVTVAAPALALALPMIRFGSINIWLAVVSVVMVAWHLPTVYTWIWQSDIAYWGMQFAMLGSAWAFWSLALAPKPEQAAYNALGVAGLACVMGFIGAILTFAPAILYFEHVGGAAIWGITPLADQQLAGLVMWVPGFVPLAALAAIMLRRSWMCEVNA
jgi:putative membrane protein